MILILFKANALQYKKKLGINNYIYYMLYNKSSEYPFNNKSYSNDVTR